MSAAGVRTVLFDLDGTLADTAPDLAHALNRVRLEEGRPALALEAVRPVVSLGGRALIELGFGLTPGDRDFDRIRARFLDHYREHLAVHTRLFPGMPEVLDNLEARGVTWGIVTNKASWLTAPLITQLGLLERTACVVSGDTTAHRKPHPEPLLHACAQARSPPEACVYVGDSRHDAAAARGAGMPMLVALFGYIPTGDEPAEWGADGTIETPTGLLGWLDERRGRRP